MTILRLSLLKARRRLLVAGGLLAVACAVPLQFARALPLPAVGTNIGTVIIGTQDVSQFPAAFIATHFDVGVSFPETLLKSVRAINPGFCALAYLNANVDPNFPLYTTLTLTETRWMHSGEPAGLHAVPSAGRIDLFWLAERRPQLAGCSYAVYRQLAGEQVATRIAISSVGATSYNDAGLASGEVATYTIKARTAGGIEYAFSEPQIFTASPAGIPNWGPLSLVQTVATDSTTLAIAVEADPGMTQPAVLVDKDQNRLLDQTTERFNLLPAGSGGSGRLKYTVTVRVATHTLSGYSFVLQDFGVSGASSLPSVGTFTTNVNNRVRDKAFGAVMADLTDPTVTTLLTDSCAVLIAKGYSGIFPDAIVSFFAWLDLDSVPLGVDDASYVASELVLMQAYRAVLGPSKALVYNGISTLSMELLAVADGATDEGAFMAPWFTSGYIPTPGWLDQVSHAVQAIHVQHRGLLTLVEVRETDQAGRIYGLASYLLTKGEFHYLALNYTETNTIYTPELDLSMGFPIETYLDATQYRRRSGLYGRQFEKGMVLVNPGDATITETLPGTMYRVDPVGGVVPELGGDGSLTYTPVTSVTLGPYTAAILLDSTTGQP